MMGKEELKGAGGSPELAPGKSWRSWGCFNSSTPINFTSKHPSFNKHGRPHSRLCKAVIRTHRYRPHPHLLIRLHHLCRHLLRSAPLRSLHHRFLLPPSRPVHHPPPLHPADLVQWNRHPLRRRLPECLREHAIYLLRNPEHEREHHQSLSGSHESEDESGCGEEL